MKRILHTRSYTLKCQLSFAQLSGDLNPLHTDPVKARREVFGGVIAHGANAVLSALEAYAALIRKEGAESLGLSFLRVSYPNPIYLNRKITTYLMDERAGVARLESWDLELKTKVMEIEFEWEPNCANAEKDIPDKMPEVEWPLPIKFEQLKNCNGKIPLCLDAERFTGHFPLLSEMLSRATAGGILAISRLAGMYCPGAQSVCSSFNVEFRSLASSDNLLEYKVDLVDPRFCLVRIVLAGSSMSGTLNALYRPLTMAQPGFAAIKEKVSGEEFSSFSTLIVGGSRGLGETTAKIVAAGGGQVTITYNLGEEDAKRVAAEIITARGTSHAIKLSVSNPEKSILKIAAMGIAPTHIFYFPTPKIQISKTQPFCRSLFQRFTSFYVVGLYNLYRASRRAWPDRRFVLFYPSTKSIDEDAGSLMEFATAKMAGETLCQTLERSDPGLLAHIARLPWLATDQALSFTPRSSASPQDIMLEVIREIRNRGLPEKCINSY